MADMERVARRIELMNQACNHAVQEITRSGSIRIQVEKGFQRVPDLIVLISQICVLKQYATAAAQQMGHPMTLEAWNGFFMEFDKACHVLPDGKVQ